MLVWLVSGNQHSPRDIMIYVFTTHPLHINNPLPKLDLYQKCLKYYTNKKNRKVSCTFYKISGRSRGLTDLIKTIGIIDSTAFAVSPVKETTRGTGHVKPHWIVAQVIIHAAVWVRCDVTMYAVIWSVARIRHACALLLFICWEI